MSRNKGSEKAFCKGQFVRVGDDTGVVVRLSGEDGTPEDHLGIWFGETEDNNPFYRTVPEEYCEPVHDFRIYH